MRPSGGASVFMAAYRFRPSQPIQKTPWREVTVPVAWLTNPTLRTAWRHSASSIEPSMAGAWAIRGMVTRGTSGSAAEAPAAAWLNRIAIIAAWIAPPWAAGRPACGSRDTGSPFALGYSTAIRR